MGQKVDVSKKVCDGVKEECEVFCLKLILWSVIAQKGTNILLFYIFEYGAEYGTECCAESGAK